MSVRQYIGARYVPKFYEGNSGDLWESGIGYEALTIVRYSTNYFCSKKPVPSTVGSPNNNPDYWANIGLLGDLVNDIAELQTRMDEAEGDIDDIESDATALTARVAANEGSILSINNQLTYLEKFIKNKNILSAEKLGCV